MIEGAKISNAGSLGRSRRKIEAVTILQRLMLVAVFSCLSFPSFSTATKAQNNLDTNDAVEDHTVKIEEKRKLSVDTSDDVITKHQLMTKIVDSKGAVYGTPRLVTFSDSDSADDVRILLEGEFKGLHERLQGCNCDLAMEVSKMGWPSEEKLSDFIDRNDLRKEINHVSQGDPATKDRIVVTAYILPGSSQQIALALHGAEEKGAQLRNLASTWLLYRNHGLLGPFYELSMLLSHKWGPSYDMTRVVRIYGHNNPGEMEREVEMQFGEPMKNFMIQNEINLKYDLAGRVWFPRETFVEFLDRVYLREWVEGLANNVTFLRGVMVSRKSWNENYCSPYAGNGN